MKNYSPLNSSNINPHATWVINYKLIGFVFFIHFYNIHQVHKQNKKSDDNSFVVTTSYVIGFT